MCRRITKVLEIFWRTCNETASPACTRIVFLLMAVLWPLLQISLLILLPEKPKIIHTMFRNSTVWEKIRQKNSDYLGMLFEKGK